MGSNLHDIKHSKTQKRSAFLPTLYYYLQFLAKYVSDSLAGKSVAVWI